MAMTTKELLQMVDKKTMDNAIARNQDALQNHYTRTAPASNSSVSARVLDANALAAAQAAAAAQNAQAAARNTATATPTATKTTTTKTSGTTKKATPTVSAPSYSGGGGGGESYYNPNANALSLLAQNYNNSVQAVNDRYALQEQQIRADAEKELREAYINYMMSRKNADNDMARLGYTGGLTESNRAKMYNNYGTIRNDINRRLDEQLNPLRVNRNAELLSLLNNYNNQQMRYAL